MDGGLPCPPLGSITAASVQRHRAKIHHLVGAGGDRGACLPVLDFVSMAAHGAYSSRRRRSAAEEKTSTATHRKQRGSLTGPEADDNENAARVG